MPDTLLTETDLLAWSGYERRADLDRMLRRAGVPVLYGRDGRICTTARALEAALAGTSEQVPEFRGAPDHGRTRLAVPR